MIDLEKIRGAIVSLCLLGFLTWTSPAQAAVFFTEVLPQPGSGSEWIELYNDATMPVSLSGWILKDELTQPSVLHTFPEESAVQPESFLVIEVNNKLNNGEDGVTLFDSAGTMIDTFHYTSSHTGLSWQREITAAASWYQAVSTRNEASLPLPSPIPSPSPPPTPSPIPSPSPAPTISPTPSPTPSSATPSQWLVTEIMACPVSGSSEWLEVYNTDPISYVLPGWMVKDGQGNQRVVTISLPSFGFGVISWSSGLLNNSGDSISLVNPGGTAVFTAQLPACQAGTSFIYESDSWQLSQVPTPGLINSEVDSSAETEATTLDSFTSIQNQPSQSLSSPSPSSRPSGATPLPHLPNLQLTLPQEKKPIAVQTAPAQSEQKPQTSPIWPYVSVIMGGACVCCATVYDQIKSFFGSGGKIG